MCGIWGVINGGDYELGEVAARAMAHRGPDDYGVYASREPIPAAMVNTRLSIIDLTEGGHQPKFNEDKTLWIVYNGEMYNYQPLREELLAAGHRFDSDSDTEVVLHAYEEWGENCLERFRGMFAFAIWDEAQGVLFAARDRLGIKPLYYTLKHLPDGSKQLAFASELKALLATGLAQPELNYAALHHYLSFYAVPSPYTMLRDVEALPPGHYLTFDTQSLHIRQYWSIPAVEPLAMEEAEVRARLRELLEESIRLRMIADVPVGAFLSGGIDSSAVVALMTQISGERLKTFSVGFGDEGASMDERSDARTIADIYETDHTEVIVTGAEVRAQIEDIIRGMDQPSGDGLNTYLVSQATASHVKVALSGLGGDELFAGYPQFRMFQRADQAGNLWKKLPGRAKKATRSAANVLNPLSKAMNWIAGDVVDRYQRVRMLYDEQAKTAMYTPDTMQQLAAPESSPQYLSRHVHPFETDSVAQLTRLELQHYMAHTLLRDTDAMSMANSLEVRVPLIDHELVEFAACIPVEMKLRNGRAKYIFAEALRDLLPKEVLNRPKRGFEMPVAAWMRGSLSDVLEDVFSTSSIERRGLFAPEAMRGVYDDFRAGNGPYMRAWALATLELWMRQTMDEAVRV